MHCKQMCTCFDYIVHGYLNFRCLNMKVEVRPQSGVICSLLWNLTFHRSSSIVKNKLLTLKPDWVEVSYGTPYGLAIELQQPCQMLF